MTHFYEIDLNKLRDTAISGLVQKALNDRSHGNSTITLESAKYYKKQDFLELIFFADSTYGNTSYIAAVDTPEAGEGQYTLIFRFYKVNSFIEKDQSEYNLSRVVHHCDVKVYSDSPDFYLQGSWEGLAKHDASIYKFTGEQGKGVWDAKHAASGGLSNPEIHLTKHLAQVAQNIDNYLLEIKNKLEIL